MTGSDVVFMRDLEGRYRAASGLADRSRYKIFYGRVRPANVLLLGINPGGDPADVMPDGMGSRSGGRPHASSAGYYDDDESDLLDCQWKENDGLLKLLRPLFNHDDAAIRANVVKTNVAFRRGKKVTSIEVEAAKGEAAPFLAEIVGRVRPGLVLLTGARLEDFTTRFCRDVHPIGESVRDPGVKQTVFRAARVELRATGATAFAVQLAHASQFNWTYERYGVVERIRALQAGG